MVSLECFNTQLIGIMNDFTKAVIIQIKSSAAVQINVKENLEELGALLDDLCVEAIDKILRIVEPVTTTKQHYPPSIQSEKIEEDLDTDINGINEPCGSVKEGPGNGDDDVDDGGMSPSQSPPTLTRHHDHRYARPSFSLSPPASADENTDSRKKALKPGPEPEPMTHSCKCLRCPRMFPSEYRLEEHCRKVHPECKTCGKLFRGIKKLREHEIKVHRVMPFKCEYCDKGFSQKGHRDDHVKRQHTGEKVHPECKTCGKLFPGIKKLREHKIKVHRVMPYKCEYCDRGFSHKGHRDDHVKRKHTGEKSCHCDICGKAYACAASLKVHRVVHFDRSFICDVCGKSFYHGVHLVRHKHIHKEVRPYQCPTCGKGFNQADGMMKHQAAIHSDVKESHLCSICGKIYMTQQGLKYHMAGKHSEVTNSKESLITCDVCGKKFRHLCQYKLHKVTHERGKPFCCHICGKSYKRKQTLGYHMYTHTGESPNKCSVCGKTFSLRAAFKRHKSIHSGEMPYSCKKCGKHFRLLTFLKAHEQTLGHKRRTSSDMVSTENTNSIKRSSKVLKK